MSSAQADFYPCRLIDKISRPPVLVALIAIYLVFPLVLFPANGGLEHLPLDLMFAYSPAEAYAQLESFGPQGRLDYMFGTTVIDVAYAVTYTLMFSVWLTLMLRGRSRFTCAVGILPFAVFAIDMLENTGIAIMLSHYPKEYYALAVATSIATTCKWLLAWPLIITTVVLSLWRTGQFLLSKKAK